MIPNQYPHPPHTQFPQHPQHIQQQRHPNPMPNPMPNSMPNQMPRGTQIYPQPLQFPPNPNLNPMQQQFIPSQTQFRPNPINPINPMNQSIQNPLNSSVHSSMGNMNNMSNANNRLQSSLPATQSNPLMQSIQNPLHFSLPPSNPNMPSNPNILSNPNMQLGQSIPLYSTSDIEFKDSIDPNLLHSDLFQYLKKHVAATLKLPAMKAQIHQYVKEVEYCSLNLYNTTSEVSTKSLKFYAPHPRNPQAQILRDWTFSIVVPSMVQNIYTKNLFIAYLETIRSIEKNQLWGSIFELNMSWSRIAWYILDHALGDEKNNNLLCNEIMDLALSIRQYTHNNGRPALLLANSIQLLPILDFNGLDERNEMMVLKQLIIWLGSQLMKKELNSIENEKKLLFFDVLEESEDSDPIVFQNEDESLKRAIVFEKLFGILQKYKAGKYAASLFQPNAWDIVYGDILNKILTSGHFDDEESLLSILRQLPISTLQSEGVSEELVMQQILTPLKRYLDETPILEYPGVALQIVGFLQSIANQYPTYPIFKFIAFDILPQVKFLAPLCIAKFPFTEWIQTFKHSWVVYLDFIEQVFLEYFDLIDQSYFKATHVERISHLNSLIDKRIKDIKSSDRLFSIEKMKQFTKGKQFFLIDLLRELLISIHTLETMKNKNNYGEMDSKVLPTFRFLTEELLNLTFKISNPTKENLGYITKLRLEALEVVKFIGNLTPELIVSLQSFVWNHLSEFKSSQPWIIPELHNLFRLHFKEGFKKLHINSQVLQNLFLFIHSLAVNPSLREDKELFGYDILLSIDWTIQTIEERKQALRVIFLSQGSNTNSFDRFLRDNFFKTIHCKQLCSIDQSQKNFSISHILEEFGFSSSNNQLNNYTIQIFSIYLLLSLLEVRSKKDDSLNIEDVELFVQSENFSNNNENQSIIQAILERLKVLTTIDIYTGFYLIQQLVEVCAMHDILTGSDIPEIGHVLTNYIVDPNNQQMLEDLIANCQNEKIAFTWFTLLTSTSGFQSFHSRMILEKICRRLVENNRGLDSCIQAFKHRWMSPDEISRYCIETDSIWSTICMIRAFPNQLPSLASNTVSQYGRRTLNTKGECALWIAAECAEKISRKVESNLRITLCVPLWFLFFDILYQTFEFYGSDLPVFPEHLQQRYKKIFEEAMSFDNSLKDIYASFISWEINDILSLKENVEISLAKSRFQVNIMNINSNFRSQSLLNSLNNSVPIPQNENLLNQSNQLNSLAPLNQSSQQSQGYNLNSQPTSSNQIFKFQDSVQLVPIDHFHDSKNYNLYSNDSLLLEPVRTPNPFMEYIDSYHRNTDLLHSIKEASALKSELLPTMLLSDIDPSADKITKEIIELFDNYSKLISEHIDIDKEFENIYDSMYTTVNIEEKVTVNADGFMIPTTINRPQMRLSDPEIGKKLTQNRNQSKQTSFEIGKVVDKLSVYGVLLEKLSKESYCTETLVQIYTTLLPKLLNRSLPYELGQIWKSFVNILSEIGENIISKKRELQSLILQLFLKTPRGSFSDIRELSVQPSLIRPGAPAPFICKPTFTINDFDPLFNGFNPSILINDGVLSDYMTILSDFYENGESLPHHEFNLLTKALKIHVMFESLGKNSPGERFSSCRESFRILSMLKGSLANPKLRPLGDLILSNSLRIAFPLEIGTILHILFDAYSLNEITDQQWPFYFTDEMLRNVPPRIAIDWIKIIRNYSYSSNISGVVSASKFIELLLTTSQVHSTLRLADAYERDSIECISFFIDCLQKSPGKTRTETASISDFKSILTSLKNIISSLPMLVEHVYNIYFTNFLPFALLQGEQHMNILKEAIHSIDFSLAVFNERNLIFLDKMWDLLPNDPESVSLFFSKLDFNGILKSNNSNSKCSLLRLYLDINLINPNAISQSLRALFGESALENTYIWENISPEVFNTYFNGKTTSRLLRIGAQLHNIGPAIVDNLNLMFYVTRSTNNPDIGLTCIKEIIGSSLLIIRRRNKVNINSSWFLPTKVIVKIAQNILFPLAMKFTNIKTITECFNFVSMIEVGVEPVYIDHDIDFDTIITICPYESNKFLNTLQEHNILMLKIVGVIEQLNQSASLFFCRLCISVVPSLNLPLELKTRMLESLLRSYFEQTTEDGSREIASSLLSFGSDCTISSPQYFQILESCCQSGHILLLTMMLHKLLFTTIQETQLVYDKTRIRFAYVQCMKSVINLVPDKVKNYELIFLFLFVIQMMETDFWDFNDMSIRDLTKDFTNVLNYISNHNSFTVRKGNVPNHYTELEISPQLTLASMAFLCYIEHLSHNRYNENDTTLLQDNGQLQTLKKLLKKQSQQNYKPFYEFFREAENLGNSRIDITQFIEVIRNLFPLSEYLFKI